MICSKWRLQRILSVLGSKQGVLYTVDGIQYCGKFLGYTSGKLLGYSVVAIGLVTVIALDVIVS